MQTENIECDIIGKILLGNEKKQEIDIIKEKLCPKCNKILNVINFYKDVTTNTGYKCYCKNCVEINRQLKYSKEKISGIYKIINKVNGKYYVGGSKNINGQVNGRWWRHEMDLNKNKHNNIHLQRAWNKYGNDNFEFVIVENTSDNKLLMVEQKYLDIAKTETDKCYNICFIAGKVNMTLEIRKKIGDALRGKIRKRGKENPLYGRIRKRGKENPLYGRKLSDETKQKIGSHHIGIKNSNYDHKIYTFYHRITKEIYVNTRHKFYTKYNFDASEIAKLVKKRYKSYKNWIVLNDVIN